MVRFLLLLGLWLALSRTLEPVAVALGAVVSAAAVWVVQWLLPEPDAPRAPLAGRVIGACRFAVVLIARFITSTLLTSWVILFRRDEGRVVALPIRLRGATRQFLLLNAITLTPSTISLLLEGQLLYVHWLLPQGWRGDRRQLKDALEDELLRGEAGVDAGRQ
jgi:multisubunit Na+/H+ antiporter MnhE subunit